MIKPNQNQGSCFKKEILSQDIIQKTKNWVDRHKRTKKVESEQDLVQRRVEGVIKKIDGDVNHLKNENKHLRSENKQLSQDISQLSLKIEQLLENFKK